MQITTTVPYPACVTNNSPLCHRARQGHPETSKDSGPYCNTHRHEAGGDNFHSLGDPATQVGVHNTREDGLALVSFLV